MLTTECRFLYADLEDAVTLAAEGWISAGFEVLDLGLASAEARPLSEENAWLVERYHRAIVHYSETYGPAPELPEPALSHLRLLEARLG